VVSFKAMPSDYDGSNEDGSNEDGSNEDGAHVGETGPSTPSLRAVPVVGVGASAGGLEALSRFLQTVPEDIGAAFVVIQHLDPERSSMLPEVLGRAASMPVAEAREGTPIAPNCVYVIPANSDLSMEGEVLRLTPRVLTGRLHLPIDTFFASIARDLQARAVGVVLSGSGSDGTKGLQAIRAAGGFALAQSPNTAQFPSMPESALQADAVDFQGTPEALADEVTRWCRGEYVTTSAKGNDALSPSTTDDKVLARILGVLRQTTGREYGGYKLSTIRRRIERRMALRRIATLEEYATELAHDRGEASQLAKDVLIHVTSFFRDPDAFDALKKHVLTKLALTKRVGDTVRVWAPGCSTGEEVYSLAIALCEAFELQTTSVDIKLFGSDLSDETIEFARRGRYPESAVGSLSAERLERFFERDERGYRVTTRLREMCIFVKHDLTWDPPFSKLDLISCRNVLIYFESELQRRVIPMLHYALNPGGHLFLGQSETIAAYRDLFTPIDERLRIFVKAGETPLQAYPAPSVPGRELRLTAFSGFDKRNRTRDVQRQADHLLLARYAPAGVLVNEHLDILEFRGRTGRFLEVPPGQPQTNVLHMARDGLGPHLREALNLAKTQATAVRRPGIRFRREGEECLVNIEVLSLAAVPESSERYFLILFEEPESAGRKNAELQESQPSTSPSLRETATEELEQLRAELLVRKDYARSLVADHQATTNELAASNEDLVAANEELQAANEELQSAKEELQSTNEELSTVNDQTRARNHELDLAVSDLANVLASVEIPVVIVDTELRIRRFTPTAQTIGRFIQADIGRPLTDVNLTLPIPNIERCVKEVLTDLSPRDWEVEATDGRWMRMQVRPYRLADGRLDGAVLAFVDVSVLKEAREDAEAAGDYARSIVNTIGDALVVLDATMCVSSMNHAFAATFAVTEESIVGNHLDATGLEFWNAPKLRVALAECLTKHVPFSGLELSTELPSLGHRTYVMSARPLVGAKSTMVLLALDDVTNLRTLEAERAVLLASEKDARLEAERANRAKDLFLATLSHELRTPLSTMLLSAQLLKKLAENDHRIERQSIAIERAVRTQSRLIDDLLDVSRIVSGKLILDLGLVDFLGIVQSAVDVARPSAQAKSIALELKTDSDLGTVYGDHVRLQQVVSNLLNNGIKFTPPGGRVVLRLTRHENVLELTVADTGMGIRPEVLPHLFSRFVQADSSVTRTHGGLGLGLSIVRHLIDVHGGSVTAESPGEGLGATFRVTLPLASTELAPTRERSATPENVEGVRVLLVEDDDDTREAFSSMLSSLGATVRAEANAAAGLQAVTEFRPQAILSDLAMPGEDGLSFIRRVRELPPEQGGLTPAAAVTALASDEDRKLAASAGFQLHVAKPVDAERLAAIVVLLLERKQHVVALPG